MAVEVAQAPFGIFPPLLRMDLTPQGLGEAESSPRGSKQARTMLEGSGEAERPLGRLRPMSFDSCLMGVVLSVPDITCPTLSVVCPFDPIVVT
jgi:hypothetical protein